MSQSKPVLGLGVKSRTWRSGYEPADQAFREMRPRVLERDQHSCVFCGFHSRKWQQVHHLDDDHANNAQANLKTVCAYCHMNFHIGKAGQDGAVLAFLPELSPEAISHLWRAVAVARAYPSWLQARADRGRSPGTVQMREAMALHDAAGEVMTLIGRRRAKLEGILGTSSPVLLGDALLAASRAEPGFYDRREEWLHGVRLIPPGPEHEFGGAEMLAFFLSPEGPFGEGLKPAVWSAVMRSLDAGRALEERR